jgi:hypothetical protein
MVVENGETPAGIDLVATLGAEDGVSTQCFSIYIPNKDRNGTEIGNQRQWILEAIRLLSELNIGATAMPPVEGAWQNDEGAIIWENPVVVYSYIDPGVFFKNLTRVREFLHRMGRETNQGEIAFEFDGLFFRIRKFDAVKRRKS